MLTASPPRAPPRLVSRRIRTCGWLTGRGTQMAPHGLSPVCLSPRPWPRCLGASHTHFPAAPEWNLGFPLVVEKEAEQDQEVEGNNGDSPAIRRYNRRRGLLLCGLETKR
jgi:hypothetical protein